MNLHAQPSYYARFSKCGSYRYIWQHAWEPALHHCVFVMLNPSTADEHETDATIRTCIRHARQWGFAGIHVVNLFALRSTDPKRLRRHPDPVGPENDSFILAAVTDPSCRLVVCAWGNHGAYVRRPQDVLALLRHHAPQKLKCLGMTNSNEPRHPLYTPRIQLTDLREMA